MQYMYSQIKVCVVKIGQDGWKVKQIVFGYSEVKRILVPLLDKAPFIQGLYTVINGFINSL